MSISNRLSRWIPDAAELPQLRAMTCADLLEEGAARHPDREAVVYSAYDDVGLNVRWSYGEFRARAREVGRALLGSGMERGDRVAIWATNLPNWLLVQYGAAYAGVTLVPLNPLLRAPEVEYILGRSGARAIFVEPENRGRSLWEDAGVAMRGAPHTSRRIALVPGSQYGADAWDSWLESSAAGDEEALGLAQPDDLAQIQFTSGTTGAPKGAELTHQGLANNAHMFAVRAHIDSETRQVTGMPLFHCGGCVLTTMGVFSVGGTVLPLVTFDARRALHTVTAESANYLALVPTMLLAVEEELDRRGGSVETVRYVSTGGSVVPPEIGQRWHDRFGVDFTIVYGLTEASPVITQSSPTDPLVLQLTCGRALPHVEWDVVDPTTRELRPLGEEGEVRARGWLVMRGYVGDEEATREAISEDGWFATGDLGVMDADGILRITGRAKDVVIRGGENLYPAEIESVIREIEGIGDANVVGVPDDRYGEVCCAFVRCADTELDEERLREALGERMARFKIPTHIRFVEEFPLTPSGKVQKFRLREQFLAESEDAVREGIAS